MLEVRVVGGNNAEHLSFHQFFQDSFRYRTANERFGTRTHLVDEDECALICLTQEGAHVTQVRRVGGQFVLDGLFVSDIDHQLVKQSRPTLLRHRHEQTALEHVLQQRHGLEAYRLTAGIRTADDEHAVCVLVESYGERHDGLALRRIMEPQHRMACVRPL